MPVSHALSSALTSTDGQVPGLLEVLAQVPDPRKRRGRRFSMVFVLAVAVICVLAGAKSFREIGDQAADLPQELLAALGARPHPLRRRITAPSEKRIRTLLQELDAAALDVITGSWLRALAVAGRLDGLLTAIAIDGKWLRGVAEGQVKLFAAMLHEEKVMIAQHRIPDDTNEITQVRELLDPVDLTGTVVTADAAWLLLVAACRHQLRCQRKRPGLRRCPNSQVHIDCSENAEHRHQPAPPGRNHRYHPDPPAHHPRPDPGPAVPSPMRRKFHHAIRLTSHPDSARWPGLPTATCARRPE